MSDTAKNGMTHCGSASAAIVATMLPAASTTTAATRRLADVARTLRKNRRTRLGA